MTNIVNNATRSVRNLISWLGPTRSYIIFFLFTLTGLGSLILNAVLANIPKGQSTQWVTATQTILLIVFLLGMAVTIMSRVHPQDRRQLLMVVAPSIMALSIGLLNPTLLPFFGAVAVGWLVVATVVTRGRVRREYQAAIKAMRKGDYPEAVKVMSTLIEVEPDRAEHYRFRAMLYRLWGKLKRSRADYEKVIELTPDSGVGYNGLAEVYLQDGEYADALNFAQEALKREPGDWIAAYNLGMIEDRMALWQDAIGHLEMALKVGIPESRHRLLSHLWIARAQAHSGANPEAEIGQLKKEKSGLDEWKSMFENDAAMMLKKVLETDIHLAEGLIEGQVTADALKSQ
jgi:hypothetical protein